MIQFKKLNDGAVVPARQTHGAAGFDLVADKNVMVHYDKATLIPTGIAMSIPEGYVGLIRPRSGLAVKYAIDVLAGVIDSDYRGEIQVVLINHGERPVDITKGDRIAQLVVTPIMTDVVVVDELTGTERNIGGFGSTGE